MKKMMSLVLSVLLSLGVSATALAAGSAPVGEMTTQVLESADGDVVTKADRLTNFFEDIKQRLDFQQWFFGHYHDNRIIERKFVLLYDQIIS